MSPSTPTPHVEPQSLEAASPKQRGVFGTELRQIDMVIATLVAVAIFLFWGGPLWSVERGAQHVGRFAGSYALVIPIVMLLHLVRVRSVRDWGSVLASTFLIWSVKFMITVPLYHFLAPGVAAHYVPRRASDDAMTDSAPQYVVHAGLHGGDLRGTVVDAGGSPVADAVVWLSDVREGRAAVSATEPTDLRIAGSRLPTTPLVMTQGDSLRLVNADAERYLVHGTSEGRVVISRAVTASATTVLPVTEAGWIEVACTAERTCGRTWIHVAPHPYHALTTGDGTFRLADVPDGTFTVEVRAPTPAGELRQGQARVRTSATDVRIVVR